MGQDPLTHHILVTHDPRSIDPFSSLTHTFPRLTPVLFTDRDRVQRFIAYTHRPRPCTAACAVLRPISVQVLKRAEGISMLRLKLLVL